MNETVTNICTDPLSRYVPRLFFKLKRNWLLVHFVLTFRTYMFRREISSLNIPRARVRNRYISTRTTNIFSSAGSSTFNFNIFNSIRFGNMIRDIVEYLLFTTLIRLFKIVHRFTWLWIRSYVKNLYYARVDHTNFSLSLSTTVYWLIKYIKIYLLVKLNFSLILINLLLELLCN